MLVSQVFVISKLGGGNLILYKYFLGTLRAFWKQIQYSRSLAQWTFVSEPSPRVRMNNIETGKALGMEVSASNPHYGFGEEATDWLLVKERVLASADANLSAGVGRRFWHSGKGMAFTPQFHCWTPLNSGVLEVASHSASASSLQVLLVWFLDQCLLRVEETLLVNYRTTHIS